MKKTIAAAFASLIAATGAHAQQAPVAGTWNCELLMNQTMRNQPPSNTSFSFKLDIQQGGQATFSGTETVTYGSFPFNGAGQWSTDGTYLYVQGRMNGGAKAAFFQQQGMPVPPEATQFIFATKPQTQAYMASDDSRGDQRSGIFRVASQCQR